MGCGPRKPRASPGSKAPKCSVPSLKPSATDGAVPPPVPCPDQLVQHTVLCPHQESRTSTGELKHASGAPHRCARHNQSCKPCLKGKFLLQHQLSRQRQTSLGTLQAATADQSQACELVMLSAQDEHVTASDETSLGPNNAAAFSRTTSGRDGHSDSHLETNATGGLRRCKCTSLVLNLCPDLSSARVPLVQLFSLARSRPSKTAAQRAAPATATCHWHLVIRFLRATI